VLSDAGKIGVAAAGYGWEWLRNNGDEFVPKKA